MDSITIVLDTDDAGLILEWLEYKSDWAVTGNEYVQMESIQKLKKQIEQELDNLSGEPDYHDPDHF